MEKIRLDAMLVKRGLAPTLEKARALILSRNVLVDEEYSDKAGRLVGADALIQVKVDDSPFVSRGGLKLKAALEQFQLDVCGLVALDVGASTGGFTDCLLQQGARKVYALDVAYGQLAWKLREDRRVVVIERRNIRYYDGVDFQESPSLATIDVSFISLKKVLPSVIKLLASPGIILALVKPQFEARRGEVEQGGVIRDEKIQKRVVEEILHLCESSDLKIEGACASPVLGPAGNKEFFILARKT